MPRRHHVHKGIYSQHSLIIEQANNQLVCFRDYIKKIVSKYFQKAHVKMNERYVAICSILFVFLLTFLLPDITNKIHKTNELKQMRSTLDSMKDAVGKAEVACLAVADDICYLRCSVHDGQTETFRDQQDLSVCTRFSMPDTQSEPVQIEKKVGLFRRMFLPNRKVSYKEIALMSFLYTDDTLATPKDMNCTNAMSPFVME